MPFERNLTNDRRKLNGNKIRIKLGHGEMRPTKKAAGTTGGLEAKSCKRCLFSRNLARRVERAGIVDLGDLVVAEAEHLAQDFVGVLAQQRRARHLAR
jgi:hypothetical protein